jgi:hypothetical protein
VAGAADARAQELKSSTKLDLLRYAQARFGRAVLGAAE